jgi:hypothetical protein
LRGPEQSAAQGIEQAHLEVSDHVGRHARSSRPDAHLPSPIVTSTKGFDTESIVARSASATIFMIGQRTAFLGSLAVEMVNRWTPTVARFPGKYLTGAMQTSNHLPC